MQRSDQVSLNAIRVFATVAEAGSFKLAAARLSVTPGAVSRQIQNLEAAMGVRLFNRSNNAIRLTDTGDAFLGQIRPSLHSMKYAIESVMGNEQGVTVCVPTTLAIRWLIPMLGGFKKKRPDIAVRIETDDGTGQAKDIRADITVVYVSASELVQNNDVLIEDRCQPYLAPSLLSRITDPTDLLSIPALQCTSSNWDWKAWLQKTTTPDAQLRFDGYFDLDDAALRAAIAGMGMVLASKVMVRDDLAAGRLCALPNMPEVLLGHYTLHTITHANRAIGVFANWLRKAR